MKGIVRKKLKTANAGILPVILLVVLALIWGSSFILIKRGLEAFSPVQVGMIRLVFASLALLPIAIINFKGTFLPNWKKFMILGIFGNLLPASLFPLAEQGLASSLTGILNSLTPIFTLLVGIVFFGVRFGNRQLLGLAIGLIGAVALSMVNNEGGIGSFNFYALFVLLATIFYGVSANLVKTYFHNFNPIVLTSFQMFSIGGFAFLYLFLSDFPFRLVHAPTAMISLGYLLILGIINTAFALILFNRLIQLTSAVFASTVTYLIPIGAIFWGVFDGEKIFLLHLLGTALILGGVLLVNSVNKASDDKL